MKFFYIALILAVNCDPEAEKSNEYYQGSPDQLSEVASVLMGRVKSEQQNESMSNDDSTLDQFTVSSLENSADLKTKSASLDAETTDFVYIDGLNNLTQDGSALKSAERFPASSYDSLNAKNLQNVTELAAERKRINQDVRSDNDVPSVNPDGTDQSSEVDFEALEPSDEVSSTAEATTTLVTTESTTPIANGLVVKPCFYRSLISQIRNFIHSS